MQPFIRLLELARAKQVFDQNNSWANGSANYLDGITDELSEAREAYAQSRNCYLEDELGDILWNYLNAVLAIEAEKGIVLESVLERSVKKYSERLHAITHGGSWAQIKQQQKAALAQEYQQDVFNQSSR